MSTVYIVTVHPFLHPSRLSLGPYLYVHVYEYSVYCHCSPFSCTPHVCLQVRTCMYMYMSTVYIVTVYPFFHPSRLSSGPYLYVHVYDYSVYCHCSPFSSTPHVCLQVRTCMYMEMSTVYIATVHRSPPPLTSVFRSVSVCICI